MSFGDAIRFYMESQKMQQADLARATGFSTAYVNMVIKNEVKDPSISKAKTFADALGITLDQLAEKAFME